MVEGESNKRGLASANKETRLAVSRKGGIAPHLIRGLAAADPETRRRVASAGGKKRAQEPGALSEAGKKGGERVKELYGTEHYKRIGEMGGNTMAKLYGTEHYKRIGKMGGNTVVELHGEEYFSEIGKKGGEVMKKKFEQNKKE